MAITKNDIDNTAFATARNGYDPQEVDELLERVGDDLETLSFALAEANYKVNALTDKVAVLEAQIEHRPLEPSESSTLSMSSDELLDASR